MIDYDYLDKLSDAEKEWLNKFTEEYTNASFKKDKDERIQKKKKYELDAYKRNNDRNSDILTKAKAAGKIHDIEHVKFNDVQLSPEEILVQREELKEILSSPEVIEKMATDKNIKKLADDLRDKLADLDELFNEVHRGNNGSK